MFNIFNPQPKPAPIINQMPRCRDCGDGYVRHTPIQSRCKECGLKRWREQKRKNLQKKKDRGELIYKPLIKSAPRARFSPEIYDLWDRFNPTGKWSLCLGCIEAGFSDQLQNHANCLHHIMGREGYSRELRIIHNSLLNSCPINNENCHLKDHSKVKNNENILAAVFGMVKWAVAHGLYQWKKKDIAFYEHYKEIYQRNGCFLQSEEVLQKVLPRSEYFEKVLLTS